MSVVPSFCCCRRTGCGGVIEPDSGKPTGVHVDLVYPDHHASMRGQVSRVAA